MLQSLQLAVLYVHGRSYSFHELLEMLPEAGFLDGRMKSMSLLRSESLVLATKAPSSGSAAQA